MFLLPAPHIPPAQGRRPDRTRRIQPPRQAHQPTPTAYVLIPERSSCGQSGFSSGGSRRDTVQTHRRLTSVGWCCMAASEEWVCQSRLVRDRDRGSGGGPVSHDAHRWSEAADSRPTPSLPAGHVCGWSRGRSTPRWRRPSTGGAFAVCRSNPRHGCRGTP
jgi:hypothetical protein